MEKLPKLTLMQKRFLKYYLLDPTNASEAARKAGYSPKSSNEQACQLLNNPKLLPYLKEAGENGELDVDMDVQDIMSQLKGMAETNMFDVIEESASGVIIVKKLSDIPHEYGQYIQSIKEGPNGVEIKFYDKFRPLDMLAKIKGMYKEDNEQKSISINIDKSEEKL